MSAPGVDGQGTKNFGFRSIRISLKVSYVDSSLANVASAFHTDMNTLTPTPFTSTIDGQTYYGCILDGDATRLGKVKSTGLPSALFYGHATIVLEAVRLS